jgi:hypothetical protein
MQAPATPASLSRADISRLADELADTAAHLDAATHRLLTQMRAFDLAQGWAFQGALSCPHWLSWRIGMTLGAAREKLRVAHALAALPLIDDSLRRGELSYSKVRAMTRVATAGNEAMLLTMARHTTAAQLERMCRLYRPVQAGKLDAREIEDGRRFVTTRPTDDGMVSIQIRVLPDEAARILAAIDAHATDNGRANRADGAVALAEAGLRAPGGAAEMVRPPVEVVVHVAAETLQGVTDLGDGIPAETCRRLLCDCGVVPMLDDARGAAIDVGRRTRTIPVALRRALAARDGGCRFPGCSNRRFVDGHHIVHWIDGGATSLDNTLLLCRRHHRHVHEHGFTIDTSGDELIFRDPAGRVVPAAFPRLPLPLDPWARLEATLRAGGVTVDATSNLPGWDGDPVDYHLCVAALADDDGIGRLPAGR